MSSTWLPSVQTGTAANRPTTPNLARNTIGFYYATDTNTLSVYEGGTWDVNDNVSGGTWSNISVPYQLVDATGATVALAAGAQTVLLDVSGGSTLTLPAATGSGATYEFYVKTVSTTGYVIKTNAAPGTDVMQGVVYAEVAGTAIAYPSLFATGNKVVTLNGTTKGGVGTGDRVTFKDIATGTWQVLGFVTASGTQATPFSTS